MFYRNKIVLVTGGTGFVGSHIVDALVEKGARVRIPVHKRRPVAPPNGELVACDLTNYQECLAVCKGVDYVFHAAGPVGALQVTGRGMVDRIVQTLVLTAQAVRAACQEGVKRLLLFSSSTAYPASVQPLKEPEMWRSEPHPAYFGYGWMRRYLERFGEFVASQTSMNVMIVRPATIYGPRDNFDAASCHVVAGLIRRAIERQRPYVVWGTGDEVRDILHVRDLAEGCLLALEKGHSCEPYNLGAGQGVTVRALAELALKVSGYADAELCFDASKPVSMTYRVLDTSRAAAALGFMPRVDLETGMRETVEWFRAHGSAGGTKRNSRS